MRRRLAGFPVTVRRALAGALLAHALASPAGATVWIQGESGGRPVDLFGDHMVLQRDAPVPVWGRATSNQVVTVSVASQTKTTTASASGVWRLYLDPMPAGGPYELVVSCPDNTITLTDVMIGDVWLMAGQSNLMIKRLRPGDMAEYPDVRVFKRTWDERPGGIPWNFGRELNTELGVPIGVLQRGMRGSSGLARTWLGPDAVESTDPVVQAITATTDWGQSYEAVIRDVSGFAIKGVVWWQGEADSRRRENAGLEYGQILREIIRSWRSEWNQGPFPFLFLAEPVGGGYQPEQSEPGPLPPEPMLESRAGLMRQAYVDTLAVENTTLITSADLVDGLHPRDREGYCRRIVGAVLARVYDYGITYAGPTVESATIENGNKVRIKFREGTNSGMYARGGPLQGFEIAATGWKRFANAEIDGTDVIVWHDEILFPKFVRYGYALDFTFANLFNDADMAAPTFTVTPTKPPSE
jgi:sialate O-acetylesterase